MAKKSKTESKISLIRQEQEICEDKAMLDKLNKKLVRKGPPCKEIEIAKRF